MNQINLMVLAVVNMTRVRINNCPKNCDTQVSIFSSKFIKKKNIYIYKHNVAYNKQIW